MTHFNDWGDELGPARIIHVYDPTSKLEGVIVIDTPLWGVAGGGIRMVPDICTQEVCGLARAMTYKFAALDLPVGGAKSGLWSQPGLRPAERSQMMRSFGRAIRGLMLEGKLSIGLDIGTSAEDLNEIYAGARLELPTTGLGATLIAGERLENLATGFGAVVAAKAACEYAGLQIEGATAAVEGFGKAGSSAVRYLREERALVVAVSTIQGALYQPNGLDVELLLQLRQQYGDDLVYHYNAAQRLPSGALYTLPVDILVPGARPHVIHAANASVIQAQVIAGVANNPVTTDAARLLHERGVYVVPDFISNVGGAITVLLDWVGGSPEHLFHTLRADVSRLVQEVFAQADREHVDPSRIVIARAHEKLRHVLATQSEHTFDEVKHMVRKRFQLSGAGSPQQAFFS